jgi:hypothetical protein
LTPLLLKPKTLKSLRYTLLISLIVSLSYSLYGQIDLNLHGRIIDLKSGIPVPFASIKLLNKNGNLGVVSNIDGDFQIPFKYKAIVDTIVISCIGYQTKKILLKELLDNNENIVSLRESTVQLSEIVIKAKKKRSIMPERIVKKAIENIPNNYLNTPNSYLAYYRDYQLRENDYINLNESIVEIFDKGLSTNDQLTTKILLLDYKQNNDFIRDSTTLIPYDNEKGNKFIPGATLFSFGGNELTVLRVHDAIRNYSQFSYSFVNTLNVDFIKNHYFNLVKTVYLDEIPMYNVTFQSSPMIAGSLHFAKGSIFIEQGNFAIHKFEYSVFEKQMSESKLLYSIHLEYEKDGPTMRLNYISLNNFFNVKNPLDFKVIDVLLDRRINAFIVKFNHKPEPNTALEKKNYFLRYNNKKIEIEKIKISKNDESEVYVYIRNNPITDEDPLKIPPKLKADFERIKDFEGREVNKLTFIPVNQFRELFVQKTTNSVFVQDTLFILKNEPLFKSRIRHNLNKEASNYWMNTPLKRE